MSFWTSLAKRPMCRPMTRGLFITLEGGEGTGKSTQLRRLAGRIARLGRDVVATREPGGSAGAEVIRELLVNGSADRWSPFSETLLIYAARRDHIERTIAPALKRGAIVVCDRFADSTRAYQGGEGGAPPALINCLEREILGEAWPDLTLVLDLPVSIGLARAADRRHGETRFESKGDAFHLALRERFLVIAAADPARCVVIDAAADVDAVEAAIWTSVSERLRLG